jgi:hypothetical protein
VLRLQALVAQYFPDIPSPLDSRGHFCSLLSFAVQCQDKKIHQDAFGSPGTEFLTLLSTICLITSQTSSQEQTDNPWCRALNGHWTPL